MPRKLKPCIIILHDWVDIDGFCSELENWGIKINHKHTRFFNGVSCGITKLLAKWIDGDDRIKKLHWDDEVYPSVIQTNAPNHLDRIDQRLLPLSGSYTYTSLGNGVPIWIVDTGINDQHRDFIQPNDPGFFDSRVIPLVDPLDPSQTYDPFYDLYDQSERDSNDRGFDDGGHGTFVASLAGGITYGVAKDCILVNCKALSSRFSSFESIIISTLEAIDIMADNQAVTNGIPRGILNLSFERRIGLADPETPMEMAIRALVAKGFVAVAAAGNGGVDARLASPARLPEVITVGAIDQLTNEMANFGVGDNDDPFRDITELPESDFLPGGPPRATNFGPLVDIFAPGFFVEGASNVGITASRTWSGSSFAAPLVSGVAALWIEDDNSLTPTQVEANIISSATLNEITNIESSTPNRILFSFFTDHSVQWVFPEDVNTVLEYEHSATIEQIIYAVGSQGAAINYSLSSGILPPSLTITPIVPNDEYPNGAALISGTILPVTANQTFNFTITATQGAVSSDRFITVNLLPNIVPMSWFSPQQLGDFEEGTPISIQLSAGSPNGVAAGDIDYTLTTAFNIPGLSLSNTGVISGTLPIVVNRDFEVSFEASASDGVVTTPRQFTFNIAQRFDFVFPEPQWITPGGILGTFEVGDNIAIQLEATDSDGKSRSDLQFMRSISTVDGTVLPEEGMLPPGLLLNIGGLISGRVSVIDFQGAESIEYTFAVYVNDGANISVRTFSIVISNVEENLPPEWVTPSGLLGTLNVGDVADFQLQVTDIDGPSTLEYSAIGGTLPPGVNLGQFTGRLTGVVQSVQQTQTYTFVVRASDSENTVSRSFSIRVEKENLPPIWVTPEGFLGEFNEGAGVNIQLEAVDPNGDQVSYFVVAGDLPPTLTLNPDTGRITGSLSNVEEDTTFTFRVRADDRKNNPLSLVLFENRDFEIRVRDGALNPNSAPTWVTPSGLLTNSLTGLMEVDEGSAFRAQLVATDSDGPSPIRYTPVAGNLPPGLVLNQQSGVISGFVATDVNVFDETYNFTIRAFDGINVSDRSFSILVNDVDTNEPPAWITPAGNIGTFNELDPVIIVLQAIDPENQLVSYSIDSGALPPGLTLDSNGVISGDLGQVSLTNTFNFTVIAEDTLGAQALRPFSITVNNVANLPPQWITPAGDLGSFDEGSFINIQLEALDPDAGPLPLEYSLSSGSLPLGLNLQPGGLISGIAQSVASDTTSNFTVEITDGVDIITRDFSITISFVPQFAGFTSDLTIPLTGNMRLEWNSWNNDDVVPSDQLYQPTNPSFGRVLNPELFVAGGIQDSDPDEIFSRFGIHHDTFRALMTTPQVALVRDLGTGEILYEVIYIEVRDRQEGSDFVQPAPFVSKSFEHLRTELLAGPNQEVLPDWMTTEQVFGDPTTVIGYIPAFVVAYVLPNSGQEILENINTIEQVTTTLTTRPTQFDVNFAQSENINPVVTPGTELRINGFTVTFTGDDVFDAVDDISGAGIPGISATASQSLAFVPDGNGGLEPVTGFVLQINYTDTMLNLENGNVGDAIGTFGLSNKYQTTTFDSDSTTFDRTPLFKVEVVGGPGLRFAGRILVVDRYLAETSNDNRFWLKFGIDTNRPLWEMEPGSLGILLSNSLTFLQVEAESPRDRDLTYTIVFGGLPDGLALDPDTGQINGITPNIIGEEKFYFVVRATDTNNEFAEMGFEITVTDDPVGVGPTSFDTDTTTFDGDSTTFTA